MNEIRGTGFRGNKKTVIGADYLYGALVTVYPVP